MVSRKVGRETHPPHPEIFMQLFDNLENIIDAGSHFGAHWILKGVPKSTVFESNLKQTRKMRYAKRVAKHMIR